jgi:hypothetical protein
MALNSSNGGYGSDTSASFSFPIAADLPPVKDVLVVNEVARAVDLCAEMVDSVVVQWQELVSVCVVVPFFLSS